MGRFDVAPAARSPRLEKAEDSSLESSLSFKKRYLVVLVALVGVLLCRQIGWLATLDVGGVSFDSDVLDSPRVKSKEGPKTSKTTTTEISAAAEIPAATKAPPDPLTVLPDDATLQSWRKHRYDNQTIFNGWYANGEGTGELRVPADTDGPVLDFAIIGFPKCGTTGMMKTLARVSTMPPDQDVCTPVDKTTWYAYHNWPKDYQDQNHTRMLKGTKCPYYTEGPDLDALGRHLPKTRLIAGIRHPVKWYQSFLNQQYFNIHSKRNKFDGPLEFVNARSLRTSNDDHECLRRMTPCAARARFHLSLARLGKTPRDDAELALLTSEQRQARKRRGQAPDDLVFGKHTVLKPPSPNSKINKGVPNPVFLFDSSQGREEYFYEALAAFVKVDRAKLPAASDVYKTGNGINDKTHANSEHVAIDLCHPDYDHVRQELLPISYTLGRWLTEHLLPAAKNRSDVVIPNATAFAEKVRAYARDPCGRLVRNETDGEYYPVATAANNSTTHNNSSNSTTTNSAVTQ